MKFYNTLLTLLLAPFVLYGQVTISPQNASGESEITIIYDATIGTSTLQGVSKVYMHAGVVTEPKGTTWEYVKGNWGKDDGIGSMSKVSGEENKWNITLTPRLYFEVPGGKKIFRLAMVFRSADGNKEGKNASGNDIFMDLNAGAYILIQNPKEAYKFVQKDILSTIEISGTISQQATSIRMQVQRDDNDAAFVDVNTVSNTNSYSTNYTLLTTTSSSTTKTIDFVYKIIAVVGGNTLEKTFNQTVVVYDDTLTATDNTDAWELGFVKNSTNNGGRFSIQAPQYNYAYVIGSFSDWKIKPEYQLYKNENIFHKDIIFNNLSEGINNIQYQYVLGGNSNIGTSYVQVADPFSTLVIDPNQDKHIDNTTFPNLPKPEMPSNGIVSLIQLGVTPYRWSNNEKTWTRPPKEDLVIYELLIRDWNKAHSFQSLIDNMDYFTNLGVNAIELMPVNEFEGNLSWGYNPSFHNALDKYYGTPKKFKEFVDLCHQNNISVIVDVVYNHVFSQSPIYQMYKNPQDQWKPTSNSPYLNVVAPHPYSVGYDLNHTSKYTQRWVHQTLNHWVSAFHLDGFRFDLTKGFTQTQSTEQTASQKDVSRIANILRYTDKLHKKDNKLYLILEHFAEKSEEDAFILKNLLPWKKMFDNYKEIALGATNLSRSNISDAKTDDYITYMESHDEQRIVFETSNYGQVNGNYNIKNKKTALQRLEGVAVFFCLVPGPKMMWQFQELGYPIDINENGRTGNKPYAIGSGEKSLNLLMIPENKNLLEVYKGLLKIRSKYREVLRTIPSTNFVWNGDLKPDKIAKLTIKSTAVNIVAVANFNTSTQETTITFPKTGTWYNVFDATKEAEQISTLSQSINLQPGSYVVYIDKAEDQFPVNQNATPLAVANYNLSKEYKNDGYIFPNPNYGILKFNSKNFLFANGATVKITSPSGRELYCEYHTFNHNKLYHENVVINLMDKGFYYKGLGIITIMGDGINRSKNVIFK